MGNLYDGAFRTILHDCRQLIIPVINEIFGEEYTGEEAVEFHPNEHFMDRQDAADQERITDSNFTIFGREKKKYHIECESSLPDGRMTIRLFEYDAQIALDEGEVVQETLTVTFPHTAVLYLRTYKKTPDQMRYVIRTPGGTVAYDVPILKVQAYSLEDIFSKRLLFLIPFYIFSHEKDFPEYNENEQKLAELREEYQSMLGRLEELEQQGKLGAFDKRTIIEISGDVVREIAQKYQKIQEGIGDMMRGALLETEARKIKMIGEKEGKQEGRKEGRIEGRIEGRKEANKETALRMLSAGKYALEEIADISGLTLEEVRQLGEGKSA